MYLMQVPKARVHNMYAAIDPLKGSMYAAYALCIKNLVQYCILYCQCLVIRPQFSLVGAHREQRPHPH